MTEKSTPKKASPKDWHRADIVAALRKAGWSLRKLAVHHGYSSPTTLTTALDRPWPKGERLIADAIGIDPETIWPARYTQNYTRPKAKDSTLQGVLNPRSKQCKSQAA
ncbi:Nlp family transcriptional regulator [Marinobacter nauticus]|uniref:Nlp family transcriptional regulator n=1 Tax=Marinobacter nauticus TaxID=2743 RepID=A0A368X3K1_MARNT|nr:helix-turn-helix domain-containing protein [Marinobacter nauticus]RCW62602.1 Nlp family transcriptional regulator [Marinobacter nauticus]